MQEAPKKDHFLVRVPEPEGTAVNWKNTWLKPEPLSAVEFIPPSPDEAQLEKIKTRKPARKGTWNLDFFHSPMAIKDPDRPYYPYLLLGIDQLTGLVFVTAVADHSTYEEEFQNRLIRCLEKEDHIPRRILVQNDDAYKLFKPITSYLNIELTKVKFLKALALTKTALYDSFL